MACVPNVRTASVAEDVRVVAGVGVAVMVARASAHRACKVKLAKAKQAPLRQATALVAPRAEVRAQPGRSTGRPPRVTSSRRRSNASRRCDRSISIDRRVAKASCVHRLHLPRQRAK
jgi:hypothetical protein